MRRNAYNMVLHKFGSRLYTGLTATLMVHLQGVAVQVEQAQGAGFLPELRTRWQEHNKGMQMIRCVLTPRFLCAPSRRCAPRDMPRA